MHGPFGVLVMKMTSGICTVYDLPCDVCFYFVVFFYVMILKFTCMFSVHVTHMQLSTLLLYYSEEERWRVNTSYSRLCGLSDAVRVLKVSVLQYLHRNTILIITEPLMSVTFHSSPSYKKNYTGI